MQLLHRKRASRQQPSAPPPPFLTEEQQDEEVSKLELASQRQARFQSLSLTLVLAASSFGLALRVASGSSLSLRLFPSSRSRLLDALAAASLAGSSVFAADSCFHRIGCRRRKLLLAASVTSALLVAISWALAFLLSSSSSSRQPLPPPRFFAWLPFPSLLGALAAWRLSKSLEEVSEGIEEMRRARYRLKGA